MRFNLDEQISPQVAEIARSRCGLDVLTSHEAGTLGWSDADQMLFAGRAGRCLVTQNLSDFIAATRAAHEAGTAHAGVLIVRHTLPNGRFTAIAAALRAYAERHPDGLRSFVVDFLSHA